MGILQRIKESVSRLVRRKPKPKEEATYTTQYDPKTGEVVGVSKTSNLPPPPKSMTDRANDQMGRHTEAAQSIIGKAKEVSGKIKKAAGGAVEAAQEAPQKLISRTSEYSGASVSSKGRTAKKTVQIIRRDVAEPGNIFIGSMTGIKPASKDPYKKVKGKTLYGRKISKKEEKELQKKYGRNWRMAIRQDRQRRLYTATSPQDMAAIRRENQLDRTSVDFGSQFPESTVFLTSQEARVPFARRTDNPWDVDAMFKGKEPMRARRTDPFNIDANFKGKLKL